MQLSFDPHPRFDDALNWIGGEKVAGSGERVPIVCPWSGQTLADVAFSRADDVARAVRVARQAFPDWKATPIKERVQVMFRFKALLEAHRKELGKIAALESGKLPAEAEAGLMKGVEVVEFACALPNLIAEGTLEVSRGVECGSRREPLGVTASIVPFNFPIMVPLWTLPIAITTGNCFLLKASEQVPLSMMRVAELLREAGLPDGVFNIVQGGQEAVEAICDHPEIAAVSFVGSTRVARAVYTRATAAGKRALCMGGAKNHTILMPDATPDFASTGIVNSAMGCAGQRCMAVSNLVAVGDPCQPIIDRMGEYARSILPGDHIGAIINRQSYERILKYIEEAEQGGARILVDGRNRHPDGLEEGYWLAPTLIDGVTPDMPCAQDEIFGPVLSILRVPSLEEAVAIENGSPYGNAASIFTNSGDAADYLASHASSGMIGVNIGVPVPREPFSFGGFNDSRFGAGDITGEDGIRFWTQNRKVTVKWLPQSSSHWLG